MESVKVERGNLNNMDKQQGSRAYLIVICLVAATGGLLFGFDTAVISGAVGMFGAEFDLSAAMKGWAASSALIGCMLGALTAGAASDRFGRKKLLLLAAVLFTGSSVWCGLAASVADLVRARIMSGIAIGIASMLSPMYIAEVSPPRLRGRLVSLQQFAIISGILAAYFSNALILGTSLAEAAQWRWMFAVGAFPAAVFLLLLLFVPESPRWLLKQGRLESARSVLTRVAGQAAAEAEIASIRAAIAEEGGRLAELFRPGLRKALLVGVGLAILQQVTGINAILYYAPEIFKSSGSAVGAAFNDTVWVGIFNMLFTFVAIALIDRLGRKPLLLLGAAGMGLSLVLVGLAFHYELSGPWLLALILCYVSSFAASLGPVVWVVMSEIYPTRIRGRAMSVATVTLWGACYLVSQTFLMMNEALGAPLTFWTYAVLCVVTIVFVAAWVPETRGKTLEEIERSWTK